MRPLHQNAAGLTGIYLPEDVVIMLDELEVAEQIDLARVYAAVRAADPVRQRLALWDRLGRAHSLWGRRQQDAWKRTPLMERMDDRLGPREAIDVYDHIVNAMARTLFVDAYASFHDRLSEDRDADDAQTRRRAKRLLERFEGASDGEAWEDAAPLTPEAAGVAAVLLAAEIADMNDAGWIEQLAERAYEADVKAGGERFPWDKQGSHYLRYAEEFGSDLALMALGHGVSWFDGHADFPLKVPDIHTIVNVDDRGRLFFECSGCR